MLLVQEHLIKLGGVKLSGQMKSIEVTEAATIENIEDDKGKTKANQPTGYEGAKIAIEFILEEGKHMTTLEQVAAMQRLFKPYGQKKPKLLTVVNEDCAARGISKVYFQGLATKSVVAESGRTATLELLAPVIGGIKLKKKKTSFEKLKEAQSVKQSKGKKNRNRSPAGKKRETRNLKTKAGKLIKQG